jgi:mono/diheme cytochrome c family protein
MSGRFFGSALAAAVLWAVLAFAAPMVAGAQTLTLADRAQKTSLTRDTLLARPDVREITLDHDPVYGHAMTYRAIPAASLLKGLAVGADDYVQAKATDDFSVSIPARLLGEAYIAIEPAAAPWPKLPGVDKGTAGPFYIVWRAANPADISSEYWSYHLAALTITDSPTKRWPQLGAAGASDQVRHGLERFVSVCMACHRFEGAGEGTMGPDLGRPMNPAAWFQPAALKKFIRNPKSVRDWPDAKMPAISPAALSDTDIDAIVAWLEYKLLKH